MWNWWQLPKECERLRTKVWNYWAPNLTLIGDRVMFLCHLHNKIQDIWSMYWYLLFTLVSRFSISFCIGLFSFYNKYLKIYLLVHNRGQAEASAAGVVWGEIFSIRLKRKNIKFNTKTALTNCLKLSMDTWKGGRWCKSAQVFSRWLWLARDRQMVDAFSLSFTKQKNVMGEKSK